MDINSILDTSMYAARILAFLTAIPFHEAAHAFVSDKLGDPTARSLGRLSLNPLRHLDPWGLVAMLVVGIGWAKPVPINASYYNNRKLGMAVSAAAGPASNLLLAFVNIVLYKLFGYLVLDAMASPGVLIIGIYFVFYWLAYINVILVVFNLIPIPPFDGSRIFFSFLPEKQYFAIMKYERFIMLAVIALMWFGGLAGYLSVFYEWVLDGMFWATGFIDIIFA